MLTTSTYVGEITGFNFDRDNQNIYVKVGPVSHTVSVNEQQLNEILSILGHKVEVIVVSNGIKERLLSFRSRVTNAEVDSSAKGWHDAFDRLIGQVNKLL